MAEQHILTLTILSPQKQLFSGEVKSVTLPGSCNPFTVLYNHAPLVSTLEKGVIKWVAESVGQVYISGGFVEIKENKVVACVEI